MTQQAAPHDHVFGQDHKKAGETRTAWVIALTTVTMAVEIVSGITFGSMALLADGLHMASHAVALGITVGAYLFARKRARDNRFSFGVGKVYSLAGFASAVLLAVFALMMAAESVGRFFSPVVIAFDEAIAVAVLGLLVNGASVVLLGDKTHNHEHHHDHGKKSADHNLRAAYLHVLADALTSLLAIVALLAAKYVGLWWMDPMMGVVGGFLVARWSWFLLRDSSRVLLDTQASPEKTAQTRQALEQEGDVEVLDLHLWHIGPDYLAAAVTLGAASPLPVASYRQRIPKELQVVHSTIEVQPLE